MVNNDEKSITFRFVLIYRGIVHMQGFNRPKVDALKSEEAKGCFPKVIQFPWRSLLSTVITKIHEILELGPF